MATQAGVLKGADAEVQFVGCVLLENGDPVADAEVVVILESYYGPEGGTGLSAKPHILELITDVNGLFYVKGSCRILRINKISGPGEWLYEESGYNSNHSNKNYGFAHLIGESFYIPDPDSPAIFVLVRPDRVIDTWPSKGGVDGYTSGKRYVNTPLQPERPSVPLVETEEGWVYRP